MSYTNYNGAFRRNKITLPPGARLDSASDIFTPHATQKYALGLELDFDDATRRKFQYCKNSSAATLAKALMNVSQVHDTQAITSTLQTAYGASAGAQRFDVLLTTGNAWTDHELIDGWLLVGDGDTAAMSDMYFIKDNIWITGDTVMRVEIADAGGLRTAIAATEDIVVFRNKCRDTIVAPTTQTNGGPAVGVSLADVTASYYYWAQYRGYCPMVVDTTGTLVVGEPVGRAATLDVAGCAGAVNSDCTDQIWGVVVYASTDAECAIVDLQLP